MIDLRSSLKPLLDHFRLQTDDMDVVRAQFREFMRQAPLLYLVLACNAVAVSISFTGFNYSVWSSLFPASVCMFALVRCIWWHKQKSAVFTDEQICRHVRNTKRLALLLAVTSITWTLLLYPHGDETSRTHLMFIAGLTQISCVFCLMPVRSAALSVAAIGIIPFSIYFLIFDDGQMWVEAVTLCIVGFAMVVTTHRYNCSLDELLRHQRTLRDQHSEAQQLSEENRRIAFTDPLSGLPNRRALIAALENAHDRLESDPGEIAVTFIDLDGFKTVNDFHGHQIGDALLCAVGRLLNMLKPENALLVRIGGDEFALLNHGPQAKLRAEHFAREFLQKLETPLHVKGRRLQIGASIGIAANSREACNSYELLRRADAAMYRVKENGKGGVQRFDPSFDTARLLQQQIEGEIRAGLERDEFAVVYQPLVDAHSGEKLGTEALIRWPGRPAGPLLPDQFIHAAENSNLINSLGLFVLRQACMDMQASPGLRLSVNLSPAQIRHPEFVPEVVKVLEETGFSPHLLQFEITEAYLEDHPEKASETIRTLRAMGVSFALDHFGTGLTSAAYLQSCGFDCIKIDRSLSAQLTSDPKASMLITGMVFMANALDMRVVAEGIESGDQASLLRIAGCHELQGYHFGEPAPLADLGKHMPRHKAAIPLPTERFDDLTITVGNLQARANHGHQFKPASNL